VSLSTGAEALWVTVGVQPGMTDKMLPVTTVVAVVAVRLLLTETLLKTPSPPAAATNAVAAASPAPMVPL